MEDIRRRLQFDNTAIKIQGISRLLEIVKSKHCKEKDVLASGCVESTELKFLWSTCGDADPVVSTAACEAVFTLVESGKAQFPFIINVLLNQVPIAKCLGGIVKCLADLLILELLTTVDKEEKTYTCPYAIRSRPHPLITVLTNRPNCTYVMTQQLCRLIRSTTPSVTEHIVELLSPLLKFILLEPTKPDKFVKLRGILIPGLLQAVRGREPIQSNLLTFLLGALPLIQISSPDDVGEATQMMEAIATHMLENPTKRISRLPMRELLYFSRKASMNDLNCTNLMNLAIELASASKQSLKDDIVLLQEMSLLSEVHPASCWSLLKLVLQTVKSYESVSTLLLAMMTLPVLQALATPNPMATASSQAANQALTSEILRCIDTRLKDSANDFKSSVPEETFSERSEIPELHALHAFPVVIRELSSADKKCNWLVNARASLIENSDVDYHVICLVAAILTMSHDKTICRSALDLLIEIAEKETSIAPSLLPLLMFKVNQESDPEIKNAALNAVPRIATHKVAVPSILRTLKVLGNSAKLKPVSIRLITLLWQQQDRCFPHLQQMLAKTDPKSCLKEELRMETLYAVAASIRDICRERGHQHGPDLLSHLSSILNEFTGEKDAPAVALAMEGLFYLCESEVIDISTAWSVIATKLEHDTRPLVISSLCSLFSLVPELEVNSEGYEEFRAEVVDKLWKLTQHGSPTICAAAYEALASFACEDFKLMHLPSDVTTDFREAAIADNTDEEKDVEPEINGICYIRILKSLPDDRKKDFVGFLSSLLEAEVAALPRGIHHLSTKREVSSNAYDKALDSIPCHLQQINEKTKQHSLRPSVALGLLFAYDPPIQTGRDGKPRKHHIIQHGRAYHQMLYTLLANVPMQHTNWHQSLLAPQAWGNFMNRCFIAYMNCRKCELELQLEKGQVDDPTENQLQQETVWLRARDKLTDLIKSSSKGSPASQGNCLSALAGLAVTANKFAAGLDVDALKSAEEVSEHLGQNHWTNIVTNTLLSILDPQTPITGRTFQICHLRGGKDKSTAPMLAKAGACLALSQLTPFLITTNADVIYQLLDLFMVGLPGVAKAEDQPVLQFYHGVALGLLLSRLFEEHFADVAGTQGMISVWKAVDALEQSSFGNAENRNGSLLGLSACLSSMCTDGKTDTKVHVCSIHEKLSVVMEMTDTENMIYDPICYCMSMVSGSAYVYNILPQDMVDRIVAKLYQDHCKQPQSAGVCLSLGAICNALSRANHPTVKGLSQKLFESWVDAVSNEESQTLIRLSFLNGLMGLCGSESIISQLPSDSESKSDFIKVVQLCPLVTGSTADVGLQSQALWLYGALYMSSTSVEGSRTSVPLSYQYLPESSVLRASVDVVLEASKQGSKKVGGNLLMSVMRSLKDGPKHSLPPANWAGLLSPIMRMSYGEELQNLALELAIKQSNSSPSAAMFVASWMISPLYDSLDKSAKLCIYDNLPSLIKSVPVGKLKEFFDRGFLEPLIALSQSASEDESDSLKDSIRALQGLAEALKVRDHPQAVTLLLYQTLETVYGYLPVNHVQPGLYNTMAKCLSEVPFEVVEKVTCGDLDQPHTVIKATFVRCMICGSGTQSLNWLNRTIECLLHLKNPERDIASSALYKCFIGCIQNGEGHASTQNLIRWLLELMGYVKNYLRATTSEGDGLSFLLSVFACVVNAWCGDQTMSVLCGFSDFNHVENSDYFRADAFTNSDILEMSFTLLPYNLPKLLGKDAWLKICPKVIEWLVFLLESPVIKEESLLYKSLTSSLYALKDTTEFKRISVWARVYGLNIQQ